MQIKLINCELLDSVYVKCAGVWPVKPTAVDLLQRFFLGTSLNL